VALLVAALLLAGCTARLGTVAGLLGAEAYPPAMVLATGAEGEDCRTSALVLPAEGPLLQEAIERAVATVPEATLLTDVRVETTTVATGVYNRRCVRVHGSAAKLVRSIVVPAPEGHGGHHAH
jgi:hypothetical protein